VQETAWHTWFLQTLLSQSEPTAQVFPSVHGLQPAPPQSMSVSVPFFTLSEHPGP
jgi:hypothetical protein